MIFIDVIQLVTKMIQNMKNSLTYIMLKKNVIIETVNDELTYSSLKSDR